MEELKYMQGRFCREEKLIHVTSAISYMDMYRTPDFYFAGEQHDFWEMVCILDGSAGITADDRIYTLYAGEVIFHKPMEFHKIWSVGGNGTHTCILSFEAEGANLEKLKNSTFRLGERAEKILTDVRKAAKEAFIRTDSCIIDGVRDKKSMQVYFNLLELFLLELEEEKDILQVRDKDAAAFSEIMQILKEHVERQISVKEIAGLSGISVSGLKKKFHKYTGMGVREYHTQLQIKRAIELLEQGKSVLEVSEMLSYSSQFYFSSVFKKQTGVSPSAYKRQKQ